MQKLTDEMIIRDLAKKDNKGTIGTMLVIAFGTTMSVVAFLNSMTLAGAVFALFLVLAPVILLVFKRKNMNAFKQGEFTVLERPVVNILRQMDSPSGNRSSFTYRTDLLFEGDLVMPLSNKLSLRTRPTKEELSNIGDVYYLVMLDKHINAVPHPMAKYAKDKFEYIGSHLEN